MVNLFSKYIHILAIIYGTIYHVAKCIIVTGLSSPALHYSVPSTLYCSFKTFFFLLFLEFCTSHKHTHTHTQNSHTKSGPVHTSHLFFCDWCFRYTNVTDQLVTPQVLTSCLWRNWHLSSLTVVMNHRWLHCDGAGVSAAHCLWLWNVPRSFNHSHFLCFLNN